MTNRYECCHSCEWNTIFFPYCQNEILLPKDSEPTLTSYRAGITCSEYQPKDIDFRSW